jgi:long-chain acyl-CoA synthetase
VPEKAPTKKAVPTKRTAKKTTAKKATAKKTTAKKTAAKKTAAKKATAKKATAKKATAKKAPPPPEPLTPDIALEPPPPPAPTFPPKAEVERPWVASYPPLVPESYPYPDVPLTRLLDDAAKDFPDTVALDFMGKTLTYRRVLDQVDRFATALQDLGVTKGERVGLALPNSPQHVIALFATLRLGAIAVQIDPSLDEKGLAARINDAGCKVLVVLDPVYAKVERLKGRVPTVEHVVGTAVADYLTPIAGYTFRWRHRRDGRLVRKIPQTEGVLRFTDLVRRKTPTATQQAVDPAEDVALLAYSDGPDAQPRAVMLTHRNLLANVFQVRLWVPDVQAGRETVLCAAPFFEPFGLSTGLGLAILSAATMVLVPSFDPDEVAALIHKRKPTLLPATASMVTALVGASSLRKHDLSSVRACLCDSSTVPADAVQTFEDVTGGRLRTGLSLPEATALTHANPVYGKAKPDRIGLPLSDTTCALVDSDDPNELAPSGGPGRLAIRGPQVMKGYWRRPEETAAALRDGWLVTSHVAEIDDEGYFCLRPGEGQRPQP